MSFLTHFLPVTSIAPLVGGINRSNLQLWLEGDSGYVDKSGNSYPLITYGGAPLTGYIYNGHRAFSTNSGIWFQANGASTVFNDNTWDCYIVAYHGSTGTFEPLMNWLKYSDNDSYSFINNRDSGFSNGTRYAIRDTSNSAQSINSNNDVGANLVIINFRLNGTNMEFKINNGTPVTGVITNYRTDHDTVTFGALVRVGNPTGTVFGDYNIAEVAIYSDVKDDATRASNIQALADKYAIAL